MQAAFTPARVPVLVVSPYPDDHVQLGQFLEREHWEMCHVSTCEEALGLLQRVPVSIVVAESDAAGVNWRRLLPATQRVPFPQKPALVVASSKADDRLWSEVLNLGGYNVLAKPFDAAEVRWVLENARQACTRMASGLVGQESQRLSA